MRNIGIICHAFFVYFFNLKTYKACLGGALFLYNAKFFVANITVLFDL